MPEAQRPGFLDSRRRLLKAGLFAGLGLALVGGGYAWLRAGKRVDLPVYDGRARTLIAALAPAMLAGALPTAEAQRQQAMSGLLEAVGEAIAGLSPPLQKELGELFALLNFSAGRFIVAGVRSAWNEARVDEVEGFLRRWRDSRFELLQSAYAALHDLLLGAWYSRPESWAAIGYPGPPQL